MSNAAPACTEYVPCNFPQCRNTRLAVSKSGYCYSHNKQLKITGTLRQLRALPGMYDTCLVSGCNKKYAFSGMCVGHANTAKNFGLSVIQYTMSIVDGKCEACGTTEKLCFDHDHGCCGTIGEGSTNKGRICGECIRGILCATCNSSLGYVGDSVERLEKLIGYMNAR